MTHEQAIRAELSVLTQIDAKMLSLQMERQVVMANLVGLFHTWDVTAAAETPEVTPETSGPAIHPRGNMTHADILAIIQEIAGEIKVADLDRVIMARFPQATRSAIHWHYCRLAKDGLLDHPRKGYYARVEPQRPLSLVTETGT